MVTVIFVLHLLTQKYGCTYESGFVVFKGTFTAKIFNLSRFRGIWCNYLCLLTFDQPVIVSSGWLLF